MLLGHELSSGEAWIDLGVDTSWHPTCCKDEAIERSNLKQEERMWLPFPLIELFVASPE